MTATTDKRLAGFVSEIERLLAQKQATQTDISEIYKAAEQAGYEAKIIRLLVKERATPATKREEVEAKLDTYRHGLEGTPLGLAALSRVA